MFKDQHLICTKSLFFVYKLYFIYHEKPGDENEIFEEAIDKNQNQYPSEDNVTIITLSFGLT